MKWLEDIINQALANRPAPLADVPDNKEVFNFSPNYGLGKNAELEEDLTISNQKNLPQEPLAKKDLTATVKTLSSLPQPPVEQLPLSPSPVPPADFENEYLKAMREVIANQDKLVKQQELVDLVKAGTMLTGDVGPEKLKHIVGVYDEEKDLAQAPLKLVEAKYEGAKKQRAQMQAIDKLKPDSEISKIYRQNFTEMAKKVGLNSLAESLSKANLSAAQIEDLVGEMNIQNLFNTKLSNDSRMDQLLTRLSASASDKASKQDDALFKKEESIRKFITGRKDLTEDRIAYKKSEELSDALNDIREAMASGRPIDTQAQSAAALFSSMKLIQGDNSVVREGEYKNIIGAFGTIENLERQVRQDLMKQGALSPGMLNALERLAKFYKRHVEKRMYDKLKPDVKRIEDQKLDPERVLDDDLRMVYNKQKMQEQFKGKKIKIENGKIVVED